jgi:eukaryotic-like serine/threonine-protein kinase
MNVTADWLAKQFPELEQISLLGSGGQKIVFAAKHSMEGDVVLKLIHPSQEIESVHREILAVSEVQSPRVPKILANGEVDTVLGKCVWIREQQVIGRTVRDCIKVGSLAFDQILRLGLQMLEALAKAEEVRIVHRDVKPENIIRDETGDFWLLDFGVARHLGLSSLTATAAPFGKFTAGYAPPEQFRNLKATIDARADLFALGVTLYECAAGSNPFMTGNFLETLRKTEKTALPLLVLPFASAAELRDLVAAMTQKRRDHRPRTASDALSWMRSICHKENVS